ncbi:hypothetical protein INR49_017159 [Caranx melampygus]|nr:hypothetical protein INR49_017159 [Caranx melampygus]
MAVISASSGSLRRNLRTMTAPHTHMILMTIGILSLHHCGGPNKPGSAEWEEVNERVRGLLMTPKAVRRLVYLCVNLLPYIREIAAYDCEALSTGSVRNIVMYCGAAAETELLLGVPWQCREF